MVTKEAYREDPCGVASLPYWKCQRVQIPDHMKVVHHREFTVDLLDRYTDDPYFRLKRDLSHLESQTLPEGYSLIGATFQDYAWHINSCYTHIRTTSQELEHYQDHPVYDPELWLAVQDIETGRIIATAIGELDVTIGEGILEWVQVTEENRGRGLGKFLVLELLRRMSPKARFVTVSGQRNNPTNPEGLYRRCGFQGQDIWHILRRTME